MLTQEKGPRFTGGDDFAGLEKVFHDLMMRNELYNGYGAYQVSFAGEKSGLSFGGNQMDMYDNPGYAEYFSTILRNAVDDKTDKPIFTPDEVDAIVGVNNSNLIRSGKSPKSVFGKDLARVNAALSSTYGSML